MENQLTDSDYARLLSCIEGIHRCRKLEDFPQHVLTELKKLVTCTYALYSEIDGKRHRCIQLLDPPQNFEPKLEGWLDRRIHENPQDWWERLMNDHPALTYFKATGDGQALKFSDFLSVNEYHQLALYREALVWSGTEDQLGFCMRIESGLFIGVAFHRGERSFEERERILLNLVRPHVVQTYLHLEELAGYEDIKRDLQTALRENGLGVIVLNDTREVIHATPGAFERLASYLPVPESAHRLPEKLERWAFRESDRETNASFVITRETARLILRSVKQETRLLLLLSEENSAVATEKLAQFKLTPRESETLRWIAEGKTNAEIAIILGISLSTAKQHVERILAKLGVENRTAAAMVLRSVGY